MDRPLAAADADSEPINILCMDGGGIRGRNLLVMVEEIEALTGRSVGRSFDLVAGTSIGGCGALFISQFPSAGEATRMARKALTNLQMRCFAHKRVRSLLLKGHLCRDERAQLVREMCGPEQPLRAADGSDGPRAFAVATRQKPDGGLEPYLLRTYAVGAWDELPGTSEAQLWQAIEATSAAPAIFPATRLRGDLLADGGLVANDPTLCAPRRAAPRRAPPRCAVPRLPRPPLRRACAVPAPASATRVRPLHPLAGSRSAKHRACGQAVRSGWSCHWGRGRRRRTHSRIRWWRRRCARRGRTRATSDSSLASRGCGRGLRDSGPALSSQGFATT